MAKAPKQEDELGRVRRKKKLGRLLRRLLVLLLVLLLILAATAFYVMRRGTIREEIDLFLSNFDKGPGYPVDSPGGSAIELYPMGAELVFVNDTNLYLYNRTGGQLQSTQLSYRDPVVRTTGSYALLYDTNDTMFSVFDRTHVLLEQHTEYPIFAADIAPDRTVALATRSKHYTSEVTVSPDLDAAVCFRWYSAESMVCALTLSQDAQLLAVGGLSSRGGVICSDLHFFSIGEQRELLRLELEEELICSIEQKQNGLFHVITDRRVLAVDPEAGLQAEYDLQGQELSMFTVGDRNATVLLLGNHARDRHTNLVCLDASLSQTASVTIDPEVQRICSGDGRVLLMSYEFVNCYSTTGSFLGQEAAQQPRAVAMTRRGAYLVDGRQLLELELPDLPQPLSED